jgi:hypothetical protein
MLYQAGRIFQMVGLAAMPASILIGEIDRDEKRAIAVFLASFLIFFLGFCLTSTAKNKKQAPNPKQTEK